MENLPLSSNNLDKKESNPITRKIQRREFGLQILLPLILVFFALAALSIWMIIDQVGTAPQWADIVVILTALPLLIIGLIILIILIALIYLSALVNKEIPPLTYKAQKALFRVKGQVEKGADVSAVSIIQIQSYLATIDAVLALFKGKHD